MKKIIVKNPSDNFKIIDEFNQTRFQEIDNKVASAHMAFLDWSSKTIVERIKLLEPLLKNFIEKRDDIASAIAIEMGMPISVCQKIDIDVGLDHIKGYLQYAQYWLAPEVTYENSNEIHTIYFEPFGVIGISIPWNYPFTNFVWAVFQNLLVGNTVVIKHSEYSMLVAKLFEKIMNKIPEISNVCQFVYGTGKEVGDYLIHSNIDALWFVGSTQTGSIMYKVAAEKMIPVTLELGGSAPAIICKDADLDMAIISVFNSRFLNSGQTCDGVKRLIVHESVMDKCVQKLVAHIKSAKFGNALDKDTVLGPLVNQKQVELLREQVADAIQKGAKIVIGGKQPEYLQGAYYEPTILQNISYDMKVWKEEVFGPVLPIVSFSTIEEAINLANNTQFGLGAYIYTKNQKIAQSIYKNLKAGNISVNDTNYVIPQDPFGGYKPASGFGRIHGKYGMRNFCNIKLVALNK